MSRLVAQAGAEVRMTLRRGESLLLTLGIPVVLLAFFSTVDILPRGADDPVDFLAPGVLALAVMSTSLVGLAIATGFERQYGVLKRLGATPLTRLELLGAKAVSVLAVQAVQAVVLLAVAAVLGWRPGNGVAAAMGAVLLATSAFAGLGMLLAGTLRAEATLAAANGLYLLLLLVSGMVVPLDELPGPLRAISRNLPSTALAEALHATLGSGRAVPASAWAVLAAWAVAAPLAAAWRFRWE